MSFAGSKWLPRGTSTTPSSLLTHLGGYAAATPRPIVYTSRGAGAHSTSPRYQNSPSNTPSSLCGLSGYPGDFSASEGWSTSKQAPPRQEQGGSYNPRGSMSSAEYYSNSQHFPVSRHGYQHRPSKTPSAFTPCSAATHADRKYNRRSTSLASTSTPMTKQAQSELTSAKDTLVSALETWLDAHLGEAQQRTSAPSQGLEDSNPLGEELSHKDRQSRLLSWLADNLRKPNGSSQSDIYDMRSTNAQLSTGPSASAFSRGAPVRGILKILPEASTTNRSYVKRVCAPADAWTALDDDYGPSAKKCGRRLTMKNKQSTFLEAHFRGLAAANALSSNSDGFTFLNSIPNSAYKRRLQEGTSFYETSCGDPNIFKKQKAMYDCMQETEWSLAELAELTDNGKIPRGTLQSVLDPYSRSSKRVQSWIKSTLPRNFNRRYSLSTTQKEYNMASAQAAKEKYAK